MNTWNIFQSVNKKNAEYKKMSSKDRVKLHKALKQSISKDDSEDIIIKKLTMKVKITLKADKFHPWNYFRQENAQVLKGKTEKQKSKIYQSLKSKIDDNDTIEQIKNKLKYKIKVFLKPPPPPPPPANTQYVTIEFSVTYRRKGKNQPKMTDDYNLTFKLDENSQITDEGVKAQLQIITDYYIVDSSVVEYSYTVPIVNIVSQDELPENTDLEQIEMFANWKNIKYGDNSNYDYEADLGQGDCVVDTLWKMYGGKEGCKRQVKCKDDIYSIMNLPVGHKGITAEDVKKFCRTFKITMYGVDLRERLFVKITPKDYHDAGIIPNKNLHSLVFMMANSHMYPITNTNMKKHIANLASESSNKISSAFKSKTKKSIENKTPQLVDIKSVDALISTPATVNQKTVYLVEKISLRNIFLDIFKKTGQIPEMTVKDNKIKKLFYPSNQLQIISNPHHKVVKKYCEAHNIPFQGQSIGFVLGQYIAMLGSYTSKFNNEGYNIFKTIRIESNVSFTGTMIDHFDQKLQAYDMCKAYRYHLLNSKYPFCVYTTFDEVKSFQGQILPISYYYVETTNLYPLNGNGWYPTQIIEDALHYQLIQSADIKLIYTASHSISVEKFQNMVNAVALTFDLNSHEGKTIINSIIGMFNLMDYQKQSKIFTSSKLEAAYYLAMADSNTISRLTDTNLFEVTSQSTYSLFMESAKPIRSQIIANTNMSLWILEQRIQKLSPQIQIIGRKVDCICYQAPTEYHLPPDTTQCPIKIVNQKDLNSFNNSKIMNYLEKQKTTYYKPYHISQFTTHRSYKEITEIDDFDQLAVNLFNLKQSFRIEGLAGTGKTTLLKKFIQLIDNPSKLLCLAFTNTATLMLNGQTFHHALGLDVDNLTFDRKILRRFRFVKYLIIDEASMINPELWHIINIIKSHYPSLIIIVAGDFNQLPPIDCTLTINDFKDISIIKEICDYNRLTLTINRRSDSTLWNIHNQILNNTLGNHIPFKSFDIRHPHICQFKHLCYNNEKLSPNSPINCQILNQRCVENYLQMYTDINQITLNNGLIYAQHMPVIAIKNNKKGGFVNNEQFKVDNIDHASQSITLKNDTKTTTISLSDFQSSFKHAFAITIHKSQGQTYNSPHVIWQWNHYPQYIRKNLQYVACSRSTNVEHIFIGIV